MHADKPGMGLCKNKRFNEKYIKEISALQF